MAEAFIEISIDWKEEKTECQPCHACDEIIYSSAYRMIVLIGDKRTETDFCLCNSCFNVLKSD